MSATNRRHGAAGRTRILHTADLVRLRVGSAQMTDPMLIRQFCACEPKQMIQNGREVSPGRGLSGEDGPAAKDRRLK
jgi:hypothetical protein